MRRSVLAKENHTTVPPAVSFAPVNTRWNSWATPMGHTASVRYGGLIEQIGLITSILRSFFAKRTTGI